MLLFLIESSSHIALSDCHSPRTTVVGQSQLILTDLAVDQTQDDDGDPISGSGNGGTGTGSGGDPPYSSIIALNNLDPWMIPGLGGGGSGTGIGGTGGAGGTGGRVGSRISYKTEYINLSPTFITIGTGGVSGVYYLIGSAICRLVNMGQKEHGIRCSVESTGGSVYNLNSIAAGELDMGVAQSDWQYHACHGTSKFEGDGPNKDLRAVFSVHAQPFTVVARADSGIKKFEDLKGKRVNIGNPGSGQRRMMDLVMNKMGWTVDDFKLASELKTAEQSIALCDNNVDAIIYNVGHPNGSIREATTDCDAVLVNVDNAAIADLIAQNAYYRKAVIPGGTYRGSDFNVSTFGVGVTIISSARTPSDVIYNVVKSVFVNLEFFKNYHLAFLHLKKEAMIKDSLSAPLHEGAVKYFKEAGLM